MLRLLSSGSFAPVAIQHCVFNVNSHLHTNAQSIVLIDYCCFDAWDYLLLTRVRIYRFCNTDTVADIYLVFAY